MATGTSTTMLRARRKDINVKPNRRLDRRSSRGMIFENEELRLRTISINAEVEKGQNDIKKLRRENEQLRREIWGLRDEYDRLEQLLAKLQHNQQNSGSEEENENEEEGEREREHEHEYEDDHESDGNGTVAENARNQQKMSRELSAETEDGEEESARIAAELVSPHRVHELCARVGGPRTVERRVEYTSHNRRCQRSAAELHREVSFVALPQHAQVPVRASHPAAALCICRSECKCDRLSHSPDRSFCQQTLQRARSARRYGKLASTGD